MWHRIREFFRLLKNPPIPNIVIEDSDELVEETELRRGMVGD